MRLFAFLAFAFLFSFACSAQYSVEITAPDTVFLNEPFVVAYKITARGDKRQNIGSMKFERVSSSELIQLKEKLSVVQERVINDTAFSFRQMIYLFVPTHPAEITLPMGRFVGADTVKIAPKQVFVFPAIISSEDSLKRITARQLLFRETNTQKITAPDPSGLVMHTRVSNSSPAVGEEFAVSWEINSLQVEPVIPSKEELEKDFIIVNGPYNKGAKNNDNPTGRTKLEYIIKAKNPGKYKISGATATVGGKQLKSDPVEIIVK